MRIISLLFSLLQPVLLFGQTDDFIRIEANFRNQLYVYPQEKIHLHTDRDLYVPGEKIRFKAYLTDAATFQPATQSRYVYVELISPVDTLVSRVMIRPENDMYYGHLFLSEIIPEGNYTLRAYTRYMENLGDDYFFKKNIRIGTLSSTKSQKSQLSPTSPRTTKTTPADFDVSFFPEGGNLVEGVFCKVALKALNRNGYSEMIVGEILDETGVKITSVQTFHAGMGIFTYIPEYGKKYFLKCSNGNGLAKQFELPEPEPHACSLTASWRNEQLLIGVQKSTDSPDYPFYLLAHCRGTVLSFSTWSQESKAFIVEQDQLPAGVIQFVLFDEQMNPLSERLVFSKNYDSEVSQVEFHTDKASYKKREKVITTLTPTPSPSERVGERLFFSVAITDDTDIWVDSSTTILSSLLLSSELKGYIENPAYYLQDSPESTAALDLLMMTHGWRRYNIPEVVKGNPSYPSIAYQTSQEVFGSVKGLFLRPVTDSEVLILSEEGGVGITSTDERGRFMFQQFEYPDSSTYLLRALSKRGSEQVSIAIDEKTFPALIYAPQSPYLTPALSKGEGVIEEETKYEPELKTFIVKAEQRAMYDEDMRVIHLEEVEVVAKRIEPKEERRLQYWANRSSDVTIRREEMYFFKNHMMSEFLDMYVSKYFNRGPISFSGGRRLMIVDGMPMDINSFVDLPVEMVESIDIFNGVGAAAFGVRGAGGVISITTRLGEDSERVRLNYTLYTPLGYQKPVEFYSPQYETLESKALTIPDFRTTIFWKPDIVISEEEEEASFEFYTSDFSTTYSVVIEGLTADGKIIRQVETIRVE